MSPSENPNVPGPGARTGRAEIRVRKTRERPKARRGYGVGDETIIVALNALEHRRADGLQAALALTSRAAVFRSGLATLNARTARLERDDAIAATSSCVFRGNASLPDSMRMFRPGLRINKADGAVLDALACRLSLDGRAAVIRAGVYALFEDQPKTIRDRIDAGEFRTTSKADREAARAAAAAPEPAPASG